MKISVLVLILVSVTMSAIAQIILKLGMSDPMISAALRETRFMDLALKIVTNPWVVGGLFIYFLGALIWLAVLAQVEVSFAYPFVGIGFILTMLLGWLVMHDAVNASRIFGTLLVSLGIVLIAKGSA